MEPEVRPLQGEVAVGQVDSSEPPLLLPPVAQPRLAQRNQREVTQELACDSGIGVVKRRRVEIFLPQPLDGPVYGSNAFAAGRLDFPRQFQFGLDHPAVEHLTLRVGQLLLQTLGGRNELGGGDLAVEFGGLAGDLAEPQSQKQRHQAETSHRHQRPSHHTVQRFRKLVQRRQVQQHGQMRNCQEAGTEHQQPDRRTLRALDEVFADGVDQLRRRQRAV